MSLKVNKNNRTILPVDFITNSLIFANLRHRIIAIHGK